jgi:HD-GYP domain-containing protein (c-di-GMP phosphodiesterase class II)
MRKISLAEVQTGMVLAKDIFGDNGQILLRAEIEMKPRYLSYLEQTGIEFVYVRDNRISDVEVEDPISEKTRHAARLLVRNLTSEIQSAGIKGKISKSINVQDREILNTVNKILDELLDSKDAIVQLVDIRSKDNYLFAHSVNCAVLATLVAKKMRYNIKELRWLATGALFHDLGMIAIPNTITDKPGELTDDEYKVVQDHPLRSYEIFKTTDIFDARAGAVVLQHHERYQGQGYPRGLAGDKISPLAQIAGIADVYDALTSERPYRKAYKPHEAVEMLMSWGEELFDVNILRHFLLAIAAYPIGSHIMLSNGESGLVIANNPGYTLRPVVRVLYREGNALADHPNPYDLDLSQTLDLTITDVLD